MQMELESRTEQSKTEALLHASGVSAQQDTPSRLKNALAFTMYLCLIFVVNSAFSILGPFFSIEVSLALL